MPSYEFYGAPEDMHDLLRFIFEETDCEVWEHYSLPGEDLRQFHDLESLKGAVAIGHDRHGKGSHELLALYSPTTRGKRSIEQYGSRARRSEPSQDRSRVQGWGVIQLQLSGIHQQQTISWSRLACNSEARAYKWEECYADSMGAVEAWDWQALKKLLGRVQRQISRKLAVSKHGSRPVMRHAHDLCQSGYTLRG